MRSVWGCAFAWLLLSACGDGEERPAFAPGSGDHNSEASTTTNPRGSRQSGSAGSGAVSADHDDPPLPKGRWGVEQIAVGAYNSCAIDSEGKLYCWGAGDLGATGHGEDAGVIRAPKRVGTETGWTKVAPGSLTTCGIREGLLYCWGINWGGTPTLASSVKNWTHVAGGSLFHCGIADGALYCWGGSCPGSRGELGQGDPAGEKLSACELDAPTRVGTESGWTYVSAGVEHTCGIQNGKLFCWGYEPGRLGVTIEKRFYHYPTQVGEHDDWTVVSTGIEHSFGIRNGGELYRWGSFWEAMDTDEMDGPLIRQAENDWSYVESARAPTSFGWAHVCALRLQRLWCWGFNDAGQVGVPGSMELALHEFDAGDWSAVSASEAHSCGIHNGYAYCWGTNQSGQLGVGDDVPPGTPVAVHGPSD